MTPIDRANLSISCHVCEGTMELVYDRPAQKVVVCTDCHSGLTIPVTAWDIKRAKRSNKSKSEL